MSNPDDILTSSDIYAGLGGCSRGHVYNLISRGYLAPPLKLGGINRWFRKDLDACKARLAAERDARQESGAA
jgi:predicted DNA-binding transcriptional regulator AlpA